MHSVYVAQDSILRVGEVVEVHGRKIIVEVDKTKNHPDLLYNGSVVKNIGVDSYIEIRKGFLSLIGKVDGEEIKEDLKSYVKDSDDQVAKIKRQLTISLVGYIDSDDEFEGGTKELPLIGNEAFVVSVEKVQAIHRLVAEGELSITVAETDEGIDVPFPVDGLFNGHIAIFGNTGSGKSNTLASLFQELVLTLSSKYGDELSDRCRFLLFDFNGEYAGKECISRHKKVYELSTERGGKDKLPFTVEEMLDVEMLSILAEATEKTQKPFLRRSIDWYNRYVKEAKCSTSYIRSVLRNQLEKILSISDKITGHLLVDYMVQVLHYPDDPDDDRYLSSDFDWLNKSNQFKFRMANKDTGYFQNQPKYVASTKLYARIQEFELPTDAIETVIASLYIRLIEEVLANRSQNEHIAPVINRLNGRKAGIANVIASSRLESGFWRSNFIVVDLSKTNLDMKKVLPLLICKKLYAEHKKRGEDHSLNIIIDEAHQILSEVSSREAESWKDYRLERFEEIIKEGRKFGVFVTVCSQRPYDISPTITSQAHNYFIHQLINQRDLDSVGNAVSYIDRLNQESIPTLPTGTCIFSGVASNMPMKLRIKQLDNDRQPRSKTLSFNRLDRCDSENGQLK